MAIGVFDVKSAEWKYLREPYRNWLICLKNYREKKKAQERASRVGVE